MLEMQQMVKKNDMDEKLGDDGENQQLYVRDKNVITTEVANHITTVASLSREQVLIDEFNKVNSEEFSKYRKESLIRGLSHGYSQCVIFFAYAGVFRLGLELVQNETLSFLDVFITLMAIIFGGMAAGQAMAFLPDAARAQLAAQRVFFMLSRISKINPESSGGKNLSKDSIVGRIEVKNVHFTYPSRPDNKILKGINFTVNPGETVALVGQSGCGKSTLIQILERFYDADEGCISMDGEDITNFNVSWWRQILGFVQQEPVLLDNDIKTNIRSGMGEKLGEIQTDNYSNYDPIVHPDAKKKNKNSRKMEDELPFHVVQESAVTSIAHDFITQQQDGYETQVGRGGGQLS